MKLPIAEILKFAGTTALNIIAPGAGSLINSFLPDDMKLPTNATVTDAKNAVATLPADQQVQIMSKELDVEITEIKEWTNVVSSLAEADKSGSSTRPYIAKMMAWNVFIVNMLMVIALTYAITRNLTDMMEKLADLWPLALAILGTPTALLRAYFGLRSRDKETRAHASTGRMPIQAEGFLSSITKKILGDK